MLIPPFTIAWPTNHNQIKMRYKLIAVIRVPPELVSHLDTEEQQHHLSHSYKWFPSTSQQNFITFPADIFGVFKVTAGGPCHQRFLNRIRPLMQDGKPVAAPSSPNSKSNFIV